MKQTAIMNPIAVILLLVCLLVSIAALSGCSKEPGKSEPSDGTAAQESVDGKSESGSSDAGESEDTTEPQQETASPAEEENPFLTIMSTGKAELLNIEYLPYKDAMINGFGAYSEDYEEATIMTIGFALSLDGPSIISEQSMCIRTTRRKRSPHRAITGQAGTTRQATTSWSLFESAAELILQRQ